MSYNSEGNPFTEFAARKIIVTGVASDNAGLMCRQPGSTVSSSPEVYATLMPTVLGAGKGISSDLNSLKGRQALAFRCRDDDQFIIIGFLKSESEISNSDNDDLSKTIKAGTPNWPSESTKDGEIIISSQDSDLTLGGGGFSILAPDDSGVSMGPINWDFTKSTLSFSSHYHKKVTSASIVRSGEVYRFSNGKSSYTIEDYTKNDLGGTLNVEGELRGLFYGEQSYDVVMGSKPRNIPICEYRQVINEFPRSAGFDGFDKEWNKTESEDALKVLREKSARIALKNDDKNVLELGKGQLIEVIAGNMVDRFGRTLDINYMSLSYGGPRGVVPRKDKKKKFEEAKRVTRRGIGYHFQLSTNTEKDEGKVDSSDFKFCIDKEGLIKLNIPKSSDTGNIPYLSSINLSRNDGSVVEEGDRVSVDTYIGKSEKIPVTLRDADGKVVYPDVVDSKKTDRPTGIRYSNEWGYFPGEADYVRVNPTKHHNMYAAAEMLFANLISSISIPPFSVDTDTGITNGNLGLPFCFELDSDAATIDPTDGTKQKITKFASAVVVSRESPAMNSGGGTVVCGTSVEKDERLGVIGGVNHALGNNFQISGSDEISVKVSDSSRKTISAGGKSANINLEGSLEMSVGSDSADSKSIVLDTAGSLIAWLGMDKNRRSAVLQTDGSVAVNIGGRNGDQFNQGRFDLRVNVTDKGFMGKKDEASSSAVDRTESDYIISISSEGIVIAGMANGKMVLRQKGDIIVEATNNLFLSATKIHNREGGLADRPAGKDTVSKSTSNATKDGVTKAIERAKA